MGFLDRISQAAGAKSARNSIDLWLQDYLIPAQQQFNYAGNRYSTSGVKTTYGTGRIYEITNTLPGYSNALQNCPPAFASQMVRALVLSQARFTFRSYRTNQTRKTFGNPSLRLLERPWPNATTGELISRMEWHAGCAGNAYVYRRLDPRARQPRLRVLRPDWVGIVYGSEMEPDDQTGHAIDAEVIAYLYQAGGFGTANKAPVHILLPEDVAHWSPVPDPLSPGMGMSWITPAIREIQGDIAATEHKLQFFKNGATPNLVIKGIPAVDPGEFQKIVEELESQYSGLANAYKTLYLVAGADASVIGSDFNQMEFTATQGRGETRISVLSRVPAALLGISEGLQGSTLNQGNFGMARRMFADTWVYPTLQDLAAALSPIIDVPDDAELWFDTRDIPLLREDAQVAADIQGRYASTISTYISSGYTPESAVAATIAEDPALLVHSGLVSVQLWEPGAQPLAGDGGGGGQTKTTKTSPTQPSSQQGKSPGQPKAKNTGQAPGKKAT